MNQLYTHLHIFKTKYIFKLVIFTLLLLGAGKVSGETKIWSGGTGVWNTAANWTPTGLPTAGDDVIINSGIVTVNINSALCKNFTLNSGTFILNNTTDKNRTLSIAGNYTQTGGTFDFNNKADGALSTMYLAGNFSNTAGISSISTNGDKAYNGVIIFNGSSTQLLNVPASRAIEWVKYIVNPGSTIQLVSNLTLSSANIAFQLPFTGELTVNGTIDFGTNQITQAGGVSGSAIFKLNSGATLITGNIEGIDGSISSTNMTQTFLAGANYIYNGNAAQVTGNSLTINTPANLTINSSNTVTLSAATTITGNLLISQGTLSGNNLDITIGGNWTNNGGTFTPGTGTVSMNGTQKVIDGTASTTFNNLTIGGDQPRSYSLGNSQNVNGTLTLRHNSLLTLGLYNLTMGASAPPIVGEFWTGSMIIADGSGTLRKNIKAHGSYTFPIGDVTSGNNYTPATLNFTSGIYAPDAYVAVRVTDAKQPNNSSTSHFLTRHWTVSQYGISSSTYNFTGSSIFSDDNVGYSSSTLAAIYSSGSWTTFTTPAGDTFTANGATTFGDFTCIEPLPVISVTTGTIFGSPFCAGNSISVPYTISGAYTSGNNFKAQLSNASGSFASPVNIGTLNSTAAGTISATIPAGTLAGTGYRIRVISSSPAVIGTDNGINLVVNVLPAAPTIGTITQPTCAISTGSVVLNGLPATGTWTITKMPGGATTRGTGTSTTVSNLSSGIYTFAVTKGDITGLYPGTGDGLYAEYFNDINGNHLISPPAITDTDATVDFNWRDLGPGSPISNNNFSVRWTGQVQPQYTENYTFTTKSDDGIRLWVNGTRIINNWNDHGTATDNSASVSLNAGQKYSIVLEYYENGGSAVAELYWSRANQASQIIPQSQLYSLATECTSSMSADVVIHAVPAAPTAPIASVTIQTTCAVSTGTIVISAPTGAQYEYQLDAGAFQSSTTFIGVSTGNHTIKARLTASPTCISSASLNITVNPQPATPSAPTITANASTTFCVGGSVTLTASAGTNYLWSTGATTASIIVSSAGSYTVQITNAAGCQSTVSEATTVTVNTVPTIILNKTDETCPTSNDGKITASLSGGLSNIRYIKLTQKFIDTDAWQQVQEIQAFEAFTNNNVALTTSGATVTSSSIYQNNLNYGPLKAIDGLTEDDSFWHSNSTNVGEWITVDLGTAKNIDFLRIFNRKYCCQQRGQNMLLELFDASNNLVFSKTVNLFEGVSGAHSITVDIIDLSWADGSTSLDRTGLDAGTYTLNYSDVIGCSGNSSAVIATINPLLPVSVSIAYSPDPIYHGATVTFTATPINGGLSPAYQWKLNGTDVGANIDTYSNSSLATGNTVSCVVTSSETCTTNNPATAIFVTITVKLNKWKGKDSEKWSTDSNWLGNFIPASGHDVEFDLNPTNNLELDDNYTIGNLINSTNKQLVIPPDRSLTVNGKITTDNNPDRILIEASPTGELPNGSLIFMQPLLNPSVYATVEMYSKASYNADGPENGKYKWQFFGIPVKSLKASPTFDRSWVRKYNEALPGLNKKWMPLTNDSILKPFIGYEITQESPKIITFQGILENGSEWLNGEKIIPLPTTPITTLDVFFRGQHVLSNPFTAAINIRKLIFDESTTVKTIFLYNTGSLSDWELKLGDVNANDLVFPFGQYLSIPQDFPYLSTPEIPSMQGFLVKALPGLTGKLTIPYSSVTKNTKMQRVKSESENTLDKVYTVIDVKGARFADRMWIVTEHTCTRKFDNGWDGEKMTGSALTPQLFAMEADGNYQVNAVDDMNNTILGFQPGEDVEDTLTFTHVNMETRYAGVYLEDLVEKRTLDISQSGAKYTFTSEPTATAIKRFKIITRPYEKEDANVQLKIFGTQGTIFVHNQSMEAGYALLYDTMGRFLQRLNFNPGAITAFPMSIIPGVYVVKAINKNEEVTKRLIMSRGE